MSGVGRDALLEQRAKVRAIQAQLGDSLRLLHGVELNIGPAGSSTTTPSSGAASTGASPRCTTTSSSIAPRRPSAS